MTATTSVALPAGKRPMHVDLASYTLRIANAEQIKQHWEASFEHWSRGRDWHSFIAIECDAQRKRLTPSGVFQTWVLVKRDDMDGRMYSGVETFLRPGFRTPESKQDVGEGRVQDTVLYGVASVVTPTDRQRRGYATHMLRLLHYCLGDPAYLPPFPSEWGAPPVLSPSERAAVPFALASILLSDVGYKFYEGAAIGKDSPGWVVDEGMNHEVVWKMHPPREDKEFDWIYERDLHNDATLLATLRQAAVARITAQDPSSTVYTYNPAAPWMLTHFVWRALDQRPTGWKYTRAQEPVGIRMSDGAVAIFTWSTGLTGEERVDLLHTANLVEEQVPQVLEAMDVLGAAAGRKEGWAFGPAMGSSGTNLFCQAVSAMPDRLVSTGKRAEVDGHLIGAAWYGDQKQRGKTLDLDILGWM